MGLFDSIPIRTNAKTDVVTAAWWNTIRSKLIEFAGGGVVGETEWTVTDNQSTYADINATDLSFDIASYSYAKVRLTIYRYDGSSDERKETRIIEIVGRKNAGGSKWTIENQSILGDDALNIADTYLGVQLSETAGVAKLQYKSDSMGGTYEEKAYYKVLETALAD